MRRRSKIKLVKILVLTIILLGILLTLFELKIRPTINNVAKSRAKNLAVKVISNAVCKTMEEHGSEYEDLIVFEKNNEKNITAVTLNVVNVNKLKSALTTEIEKRISNIDTMTTKIPLGNFLNHSILSGWGPRIAVTIVPVGSINIDIEDNFASAGINQTRHEIYLKVRCAVSVLLPLWSESAIVETKIAVAETVIVGIVPSTYTNVEGEDDISDAILNIIP